MRFPLRPWLAAVLLALAARGGPPVARAGDAAPAAPGAPQTICTYRLHLARNGREGTLVAVETGPGNGSKRSFTEVARTENVPLKAAWEWDGVEFDPFPRNPRTDASLGAASREEVALVLTLDWPAAIPRRAGRLDVFEGEPPAPPLWLGAALVDAPDAGEPAPLEFRLPSARDVSARRERLSWQVAPDGASCVETFRVRVENRSSHAFEFRLVEPAFRGENWEVVSASVPQQPSPNGRSLVLTTPLAAHSSKTVTYAIRTLWK